MQPCRSSHASKSSQNPRPLIWCPVPQSSHALSRHMPRPTKGKESSQYTTYGSTWVTPLVAEYLLQNLSMGLILVTLGVDKDDAIAKKMTEAPSRGTVLSLTGVALGREG